MKPVSITRNSVTYDGTYEFKNGMIHVYHDGKICTPTQLGDMPEYMLAQMLLGGMIRVKET